MICIQTIDTEEFITSIEESNEESSSKSLTKLSSCEVRVLAKKYLTADELLEDDNKVIYSINNWIQLAMMLLKIIILNDYR